MRDPLGTRLDLQPASDRNNIWPRPKPRRRVHDAEVVAGADDAVQKQLDGAALGGHGGYLLDRRLQRRMGVEDTAAVMARPLAGPDLDHPEVPHSSTVIGTERSYLGP